MIQVQGREADQDQVKSATPAMRPSSVTASKAAYSDANAHPKRRDICQFAGVAIRGDGPVRRVTA